MTTITQTIDSLGDVPLRSSPSNFAERGDAFLSKLPTFRTQLNLFKDQVNTIVGEINANTNTVIENKDLAVAAAEAAAGSVDAAGLIVSDFTATAQNATNAVAVIAGAVAWNAATAYALNAAAISQLDFQTYRRIVAGTTATDPKNDATNWVKISGAPSTLTGVSFSENAKGTQTTGTHTFDFNAGNVGSITVGGAITLAFSNWPASGKEGLFHLWVTNGNAFALTLPVINWVKPDRTTTTSFSTYLTAIGVSSLQSAGVNQFVIWTKDGGTTLYGKLV